MTVNARRSVLVAILVCAAVTVGPGAVATAGTALVDQTAPESEEGSGPNFQLTTVDIPEEVVLGEDVSGQVVVTNVGNRTGTVAVEFRFEGTVLGTRERTLTPGESTAFETTLPTPDLAAGTYDVGLRTQNDSASTSVVVKTPTQAILDVVAGEDGVLGTQDVLDLIVAYNAGTEVAGQPVTETVVLDGIVRYNTDPDPATTTTTSTATTTLATTTETETTTTTTATTTLATTETETTTTTTATTTLATTETETTTTATTTATTTETETTTTTTATATTTTTARTGPATLTITQTAPPTTTTPTTTATTTPTTTATVTPTTTATATPTTTATTTPTTTATPRQPTFGFGLVDVSPCGEFCREATAELTNNGSVGARDIEVNVTLSAGDTRVWRGTFDVGTLDPGESFVTTQTITLTLGDAAAVVRNDGFVTGEAVITYQGGEQTVTVREKVL